MGIKEYLKNVFMLTGVVVVALIVIAVIAAFVQGMGAPKSTKTVDSTVVVTVTPSQFMIKYNKGVDAYNQAVGLFNGANNASLNYPARIAKAEIAKGFYDEAKFDFSSSLSEPASENRLKKADYLAKASDYYSKGIDELVAVYRANEKMNTESSGAAVQGVVSLLMGRVPDLSTFQGDPESKIRLEKAKTYFGLAKDYANKADAITW